MIIVDHEGQTDSKTKQKHLSKMIIGYYRPKHNAHEKSSSKYWCYFC